MHRVKIHRRPGTGTDRAVAGLDDLRPVVVDPEEVDRCADQLEVAVVHVGRASEPLDHVLRIAPPEHGIEEHPVEVAVEPSGSRDVGGWLNRDTAQRFADYATIVADELGDVVEHWVTVNEPKVA